MANLRGALWALAASVCFACGYVLVRVLAADLPPLEIVFLRNLFGLIMTLPWAIRRHGITLRTSKHAFYFSRGFVAFIAMTAGFSGIAGLPLNVSTALSFTSPLFATAVALIVLREQVTRQRWIGTLVGFAGAMVVLRPGVHAVQWPEAMLLLSAALTGANTILVKHLTRTETPVAIVTYMTLYILPFSLAAALAVWVPPPSHIWLPMVALALSSTVGNIALTHAFTEWDASAVVALDFVRLPLAAFFGWLIFTEQPNLWAWVGGAVITGGLVYSAHHAARAGRSLPVQREV
jgi:drug/metabolite transporter (DMT)-like permease